MSITEIPPNSTQTVAGNVTISGGTIDSVSSANVSLRDGGGISLTSTGSALDVNFKSQTLTVNVSAVGGQLASISSAQVVGNVAHDAVDVGNPVKMGARAVQYAITPTAVVSGDRTDLYSSIHGFQFIQPGHPNAITIEAAYTGAQTDTAIITVASGTRIIATGCDATCDNANTVDVGVRIGFGPTNTPTTTGVFLSHPGIAPGSGIVKTGYWVGGDGADVRITCEVPTGGSIRAVVNYFTAVTT